MSKKKLFSPKEVALALGVSEATIKRWVDVDKIEAVKTLGGHRKVLLSSIHKFLQKNSFELKNPEILGLPVTTGRIKDKVEKAVEYLHLAFVKCDEYAIRGIIYDLYFSGVSVEDIFDKVLAPCLYQLGCDWETGDIDIFQERRAIQICIRTLYGFESFMDEPEDSAPIAILGTLSGDPYTIPILMAEFVLRSHGWRTEFLGNDLPLESYPRALEMYKPAILIISLSSEFQDSKILEGLVKLEKSAILRKSGLVLGGRFVPHEAYDVLKKTFFAFSMNEFSANLPDYLKRIL